MASSLRLFKTYNQTGRDVSRDRYLADAASLPLGRLASQAARLLIGKQKPGYTAHVDGGDWVVIINSDQVQLTGNKAETKVYHRHSGYVGNLKTISFRQQQAKDSTRIVRLAVSGMLPKNKLRSGRLKRLKIYPGDKHPYQKVAARPGFVKIKV